MPQLSSGRRVGLLVDALIDNFTQGTDERVYEFIVAYRLSVTKPEHLRDFLPVVYYKQDQGNPPNAPAYNSGFLVMDVLAGKAGWSDVEIAEFRHWLKVNEYVNAALAENFEAIHQAIQDNSIWNSELAPIFHHKQQSKVLETALLLVSRPITQGNPARQSVLERLLCRCSLGASGENH